MAHVQPLSPPVDPALTAMTFPAYRHLLELEPVRRHRDSTRGPRIQPLAVTAIADGAPVGLALAELPLSEADEDPELLSLFVVASHRGRGVGTDLLHRLQESVRAGGHSRMRAVWMTGKPGIHAFQNVLWKCGWAPPETRTVTVRMTVEETYNVPWLGKVSLPSRYEIFPWRELSDDERAELKRSQQERGWIAPDLQPWDFEHRLEPLTSVGVRGPEGVVGWVLNHAISPSTVRFTCSYIRKDLGRRARILPLYAESIRRLRSSPYDQFCFVSPLAHPTMAAFAKRRIGPWASFLAETRESTTNLIRRDADREEPCEPIG